MDPSLFEMVKNYHLGRLNPEDHQAFEDRLSADKAFRTEAEDYVRLFELIQEAGDLALNAKLMEMGKEMWSHEKNLEGTQKKQPPKRGILHAIPKSVFLVAAAVIVLLIIAVPLWPPNLEKEAGKSSPTELYSAHFRMMDPPNFRDVETIPPWKEAYLAGNYEESARLLKELLTRSDYTYRSEAYLYLGLCYMALDQPQEALGALGKVSPDSYDHDHALWYQALAHLKMEQVEDARQILEQIVSLPGNTFADQARQLLSQL